MSGTEEAAGDRFYVTLRVYHDDLDPEHVGRVLGLTPTDIHRRGHPYREGGRLLAPTGAWFFGSKDAVEAGDFDGHIGWLLDRLEGRAGAIERLRADGYLFEVSCYWRHADFNRNLVLSPEVMRRLVELNLLIWIDVY